MRKLLYGVLSDRALSLASFGPTAGFLGFSDGPQGVVNSIAGHGPSVSVTGRMLCTSAVCRGRVSVGFGFLALSLLHDSLRGGRGRGSENKRKKKGMGEKDEPDERKRARNVVMCVLCMES